jgi:hypothetical protein
MRPCLLTLFLFLFASGCVSQRSSLNQTIASPAQGFPTLSEAKNLISRWQDEHYPRNVPLQRLECSRDDRWWGTGVVFCVQDDRISTVCELEEMSGAFVQSIRSLSLRGFVNPLIEVLDSSHRGNGSLFLYELVDNHARLLLKTCAVDFEHDWEVLQGGVLERSYCDLNFDGYTDVVLYGTALLGERIRNVDDGGTIYYEQGPTWPEQESVQKAFVYSPSSRRFEELRSWRLGPERYHS